jgi:pre-rRNA-processing protein TSR4
MCGSAATKKCARCEHYWYCSKEHQVAHWHAAHKSQCGVDGNLTNVGIVYTNALVFPEFGIAIEREPLAGCDDVTDSEDEDSGDDR